jgi:hypothetical protein
MARFGHAAGVVALSVALSTSAYGRQVQTDYTYDVHGRLKKVYKPGSTTDYSYDAANNRSNVKISQANNPPPSTSYTLGIPVMAAYGYDPRGYHQDPDGDVLTITGVTPSSAPRGILGSTTTQITYTPNADQAGQSDSFTYTVSDGKGGVGAGTVTVNILAAPVLSAAKPFAVTLTPNGQGAIVGASLPIGFTGGTPNTIAISTALPSGTGNANVSGTGAGSAILYSNNNWSGTTSLAYTGTNSAGTGTAATGTIKVVPVVTSTTSNLPATAGQEKIVNLLSYAATTGITSMAKVGNPTKGIAVINGTTLTYTANAGATGDDAVTYTGTNAGGTSAQATIGFTIGTPINRNPIAVNDVVSGAYNAVTVISVLNGDSDPDGDPLTVYQSNASLHSASTWVNPGGTVSYSPVPGFYGWDIFDYYISDGHGGTANGAVSINVAAPPPNSPPWQKASPKPSIAARRRRLRRWQTITIPTKILLP